jgi:hypothetical protein
MIYASDAWFGGAGPPPPLSGHGIDLDLLSRRAFSKGGKVW